MSFDLNEYRNQNPDKYKDQDLASVARDIYENVSPSDSKDGKTFSQSGSFKSFDDFAAKTGLREQITQEQAQKNAPDGSGAVGLAYDAGVMVMRGSSEAAARSANAYAGGVEMTRDWSKAFNDKLRGYGVDTDTLSTVLSMSPLAAVGAFMKAENIAPGAAGENAAREWAGNVRDEKERHWVYSKQTQDPNSARGTIFRGVESAYASLAPMLIGGGVSGVAKAGALIGEGIGLIAGSTAAGLDVYDTSKATAIQNGMSEGDARNYATKMAAWETGTEAISDAVTLFTGGSGGAITSIGRAAFQNGLSGVFKTGLAHFGREFLKTVAVEGGSELLNSYAQAEVTKAAGLSDVDGIQAVRQSFGEIGVSSILFGLVGPGMAHAQRVKIKNTLTNPNVSIDEKLGLARQIGDEMNKMDSHFGVREGVAGEEFFNSVRMQLEQTGNVELTNNLDSVEQLRVEAERAEAQRAGEGYDPNAEREAILAEPPVEGEAPLGMGGSADMPTGLEPEKPSTELADRMRDFFGVNSSEAPSDGILVSQGADTQVHDSDAQQAAPSPAEQAFRDALGLGQDAELPTMREIEHAKTVLATKLTDPRLTDADRSQLEQLGSAMEAYHGELTQDFERRSQETKDMELSPLKESDLTGESVDRDTHKTVSSRVGEFVASRGSATTEDIVKATESDNIEDNAWAAVAADARAQHIWSERGKDISKTEDGRLVKQAMAAERQSEVAAAKAERAQNPEAFAELDTRLEAGPIELQKLEKRYPSEKDNQKILRNGVTKAAARFLSGHGLALVQDGDSFKIVKAKNVSRQSNRRAAEAAYDAGFIYDAHDANPKATSASGRVGGLIPSMDNPWVEGGQSKDVPIYWRREDFIAHIAPGIDFADTRVGAHQRYNEAVTSGDETRMQQADAELDRYYAERKAMKNDSRPSDVGMVGEPIWSREQRISSAAADEIFSRAQEGVAEGKFGGRIREFTDKDGNRIMRVMHSRESSERYEDFLVDPTINDNPNSARERADKVSAGVQKRALAPRSADRTVSEAAVDKHRNRLEERYYQLREAHGEEDARTKAVADKLEKLNGNDASKVEAFNEAERRYYELQDRFGDDDARTQSALDVLNRQDTEGNASKVEGAIQSMSEQEAVTDDSEHVSDGLVQDLSGAEESPDRKSSDAKTTARQAAGELRGAASKYSTSDARADLRDWFEQTPRERDQWLSDTLGIPMTEKRVDPETKKESTASLGGSSALAEEVAADSLEKAITHIKSKLDEQSEHDAKVALHEKNNAAREKAGLQPKAMDASTPRLVDAKAISAKVRESVLAVKSRLESLQQQRAELAKTGTKEQLSAIDKEIANVKSGLVYAALEGGPDSQSAKTLWRDTAHAMTSAERQRLTTALTRAEAMLEQLNELSVARQNAAYSTYDMTEDEGGIPTPEGGWTFDTETTPTLRRGHISFDDAYTMVEKKVAKPVIRDGRLAAVEYKSEKGESVTVPVDREYSNMSIVQAAPNATRNPGNYDLNDAMDKAARVIKALNVPLHLLGDIHFMTARDAYFQFQYTQGLRGALGIFHQDPNFQRSVIFIDNIESVEEFIRTTLHEVGAHAGLRYLVPDHGTRYSIFTQLMSNRDVMEAFAASNHVATADTNKYSTLGAFDQLMFGEEVFAAVFQELTLNEKGQLVFPNGRVVGNLFDKVIGAVQTSVNQLGMALGLNMQMTNTQVRNMISRVVAREHSGANAIKEVRYSSSGLTYDTLARFKMRGLNAMRRAIQDKHSIVDIMQETVRNMGIEIATDQDVHAALTDANNTTAAYFECFKKEYYYPLLKALADNKVDLKKFEQFLLARHALERNDFHARNNNVENASGWTDVEATDVLRDLIAEGLVDVRAGRNGLEYTGLYADLGKMVQQINDVRLDVLYHGNMITKAERDKVRSAYQYYMPMQDTEDMPGDSLQFGGEIVGTAGKDLGKVTGRATKSGLGLAQAMFQMQTAIRRVETNKVMQTLDRFFAANPNDNLFTRLPVGSDLNQFRSMAEQIVTVKYRGVERHILIHSKELARALKGGTAVEGNAILRAMHKYNSFLVKMNVVYSPPFIPVNFCRDYLTAMSHLFSREEINGVKGVKMMRDASSNYPSVMRFLRQYHLAKDGVTTGNVSIDIGGTPMTLAELHKEFETSGGKMGYAFMGSVDTISKNFAKEFELATRNDAVANVKKFVKAGSDLMTSLNEAAESTARFSVFLAARQNGMDATQAGRLAKEITVNFARKGEYASVLNSMYLFANAGIQGTAMMAKLMFPDGRLNARGLAVGSGMMAMGYLVATALRAMGGDDEDGTPLYDKLEEWDKNQNFILPRVPGTKDTFMKIPMPYGFGLFFSIGRILSDLTTKAAFGGGKYTTADASANIMEAVLHNFNPIGGGFEPDKTGLGHALMPQIGKIPYELATNRKFTGAPIRPESDGIEGRQFPSPQLGRNRVLGIKPVKSHAPAASDSYFNSVTPPARWMAKGLASLGFETSPNNIDHIFAGVTGGAGNFIKQAVTMLVTGRDTQINNTPILRRFFGTPPDFVDTKNFRENVASIKAVQEERDRLRLDPTRSNEVGAFERDHTAELRAANALPGYEERLKNIYIERKKAADPKTLANANEKIRRLHQEFNAHYYSLLSR